MYKYKKCNKNMLWSIIVLFRLKINNSLIFQHKRYVAEAKAQDPDVILIGASIIQLIQCYPIWNDKFVPLKSLNFGICGDRTQDVLWRVKNGILDHIKPKVNLKK